jgi:hypothetical protein
MQEALNLISDWTNLENLSVNPSKMVLIPFTKRRNLNLKPPSINGITINFSKETKYLGVILDSSLTWNPHLLNIKNKAIGSLMACKTMVGKRWGLKPKMIHWIYQTVIMPMITYASFIWWTKVDQRSAQLQLSRIQRFASIAITGAMSTTPTVALDAILDFPPLHVAIIKEAALTAFRFTNYYQFKPGNFTGHLKIYEKFKDILQISKLVDAMPIQYNFNQLYDVVILDRNTWIYRQPYFEEDSLVFYTDGSRQDDSVGIGVYGPYRQIYRSLGTVPSIFIAEVFAITTCARRILQRNDRNRRTIYILSDSRAALLAISSYTIKSKMVLECTRLLTALASRHKVTLMWVPGHTGIEGNEKADELAKKGSKTYFVGPEPFCGFELYHIKEKLNNRVVESKKNHFESLDFNSQSRSFIDYSSKRTRTILELTKGELSLIAGLLTGHCRLKRHMTRIGKANDDLCSLCLEDEETAEHILCECEAVASTRFRHFGQGYVSPAQYKEIPPRQILKFFNSLKIADI